jgi:hypothetical protein
MIGSAPVLPLYAFIACTETTLFCNNLKCDYIPRNYTTFRMTMLYCFFTYSKSLKFGGRLVEHCMCLVRNNLT